jgi:hypothetical protein
MPSDALSRLQLQKAREVCSPRHSAPAGTGKSGSNRRSACAAT